MASKRKPQGRQNKRGAIVPAGNRRAVVSGGGKPGEAGRRPHLVKLIKAGVERFILENATMDEFLRTLRLAGKPESLYAHQLTGAVLSRIIKQAINKRKQKRRTSGRR